MKLKPANWINAWVWMEKHQSTMILASIGWTGNHIPPTVIYLWIWQIIIIVIFIIVESELLACTLTNFTGYLRPFTIFRPTYWPLCHTLLLLLSSSSFHPIGQGEMDCKFCTEVKRNGRFMSIFQIVSYHLFRTGRWISRIWRGYNWKAFI